MKKAFPAPNTTPPMVLKDALSPPATAPVGERMVRTQIYLSRAECDFLRREAKQKEATLAAVIRSYIEEKMAIPVDIWANNPLLEPTVDDPAYEGREDGAINHDHYIYGCPKKYRKVNGKWVWIPLAG